LGDVLSFAFVIWSGLLLTFAGVPVFYYLYMSHVSSRPWNVKKDEGYRPSVTVLVPVYNEEKIIRFKLENLTKLEYPKDKLQIIVVNDGSTDNTIQEILDFQTANLWVNVLDNLEHIGKTACLNSALEHVRTEIVVVSDADCFLPPDILCRALPFLSDSSVGAVTGLEVLMNPRQSWVTETEILYNSIVHIIRIGESKFNSTIFFQGGFGAYKRSLLDKFDVEADDSGTALNIVQKGAKTLLLPEAVYFTTFPSDWKGKVATKLRRAHQLVRIWFRCLKLFLRGKLLLPKRIFIPEAFLYLVNPFIFVFLATATFLVALESLIFLLVLSALLIAVLASRRVRTLVVEGFQDHLVLLGAIFSSILKRKFSLWTTIEVSRSSLTREMLENKGLV